MPAVAPPRGELTGQVAIVAGADGAIGRSIAGRLAASGMTVMLAAPIEAELSHLAEEIRGAGGQVGIFVGDVSEPDVAMRLVEGTERTVGPADLLVNAPDIASTDAVFWESDPDAWWRVVELNLRGPVLCAHAVMPRMVARGRGRIVNVTSRAGARAFPLPAYAVAKCALFRVTDNLAAQSAPRGVLTIAVGSDVMRTEMKRLSDPVAGAQPTGAVRASLDAVGGLVLRIARGELDALGGRFVRVGDDVDRMIARAVEIQRAGLHQLRLVKLDGEIEPLGAYRR